MEELKKANLKTTQDLFDLGNNLLPAKVLSIYDGDTCVLAIEWRGLIGKIRVRMNGYDSPEIKPSINLENREEIKKKAIEAREFLKSLINKEENQIIWMQFNGFDKYGRVLATLYTSNENNINNDNNNNNEKKSVNQLMIKNGFGYEYSGGKKLNILV
jgi:endonuclease YncB( thermonuclease family)